MTKTIQDGAGKFSYHYPVLAVIVTSHAGGKDNAMAVGWHSPISINPPLYGIAITNQRLTHELIVQSGEFAINFLPYESAELVAAVGGSKGREIDKFQQFNISKGAASRISAPIVKSAYASYECKLVDHRTYGDHEWVVGEVVAIHVSKEFFTETEILDTTKINPAMYLGGEFYVSTAQGISKHLERQIYGRCAGD